MEHISLFVAPGNMGRDFVGDLKVDVTTVGQIGDATSGEDTKRIATEMMQRGVELVAFVGGDGTSKDICDAIDLKLPVVGVPSGVKVYGSVFACNARAAAALLDAFIEGAEVAEEEVLDIDEEAFRRGILDATMYGYLLVPHAERWLQGGKEASSAVASSLENKREIAEFVADQLEDTTLYLFGPGTTVKAIADELGIGKTLLGVDAVLNKKLIGEDLNESAILELLNRYQKRKIVVTPLGGSGFIFGRGNKQFTPRVIRQVGRENIIVVATRDKLNQLKCLRVDTDDFELDRTLSGYLDVIVGYKFSKVLPVEC